MRGNRRNSQAFCIENGREEIDIGPAGTREFGFLLLVESKPIAIMLALYDDAVFRGVLNRFEIFGHRLVILGEEGFVSIGFVKNPGNHADRVTPDGRGILPAEDVRDDLGDFSGIGLIESEVS